MPANWLRIGCTDFFLKSNRLNWIVATEGRNRSFWLQGKTLYVRECDRGKILKNWGKHNGRQKNQQIKVQGVEQAEEEVIPNRIRRISGRGGELTPWLESSIQFRLSIGKM